jgi:hypothetical protein
MNRIVVIRRLQDEPWPRHKHAVACGDAPVLAHAAKMDGVIIAREAYENVTQQPSLKRGPVPLPHDANACPHSPVGCNSYIIDGGRIRLFRFWMMGSSI